MLRHDVDGKWMWKHGARIASASANCGRSHVDSLVRYATQCSSQLIIPKFPCFGRTCDDLVEASIVDKLPSISSSLLMHGLCFLSDRCP